MLQSDELVLSLKSSLTNKETNKKNNNSSSDCWREEKKLQKGDKRFTNQALQMSFYTP